MLARALGAPLVAVTAHPGGDAAAVVADPPGDAGAERHLVQARSPAAGLQRAAEDLGAQVVALGSTHRGAAGRVLPGATAERLLHGAPCAVAVAPRGYAAAAPGGLHVLAVAYDGTRESEQAVREAAALAEAAGATIRLLAVVEPVGVSYTTTMATAVSGDPTGDIRAELEGKVRAIADSLPAGLHADAVVRGGRAVEEILAHAGRGADMLVMGSRGYGPLRRVLLGGVSSRVIQAAPCPVLLMPRGVEAGDG